MSAKRLQLKSSMSLMAPKNREKKWPKFGDNTIEIVANTSNLMQLTKSEQDKQTNSRNLLLATGKKYTIYVFLLVAKLKNISPRTGCPMGYFMFNFKQSINLPNTKNTYLTKSLKCILKSLLANFCERSELKLTP